ncbi:hypothetical protein ACIHCV_45385 [Streptomyces sp. NPDC051956]|uniref:hypothetical protein n=1 Tax=Streptomyces sp. NPDC051956 TaxID=3365677 RepID=UPI0037D6254B
MREQVTALALLRYAPAMAPLRDVESWVEPLHPNREEIVELLGQLVRSRLLRIHPSTPLQSMEWEPRSFKRAVDDSGGDLDAVTAVPELTRAFFPLSATLYAPFANSMQTGAQHLDEALSKSLTPANLPLGRQDDLVALAHELLTEEAVRYFA